jgi:hypothetical protein
MLGFMVDQAESKAGMTEAEARSSSTPSRPRAAGIWRFVLFLVLLAVACGAIWWIDRGVNLSNTHP